MQGLVALTYEFRMGNRAKIYHIRSYLLASMPPALASRCDPMAENVAEADFFLIR